MENCSNHSKELFGETDMKKVAEAIGDLHYEVLADLLDELGLKFYKDSVKDRKAGKTKIARCLDGAGKAIIVAWSKIDKAWIISKPFMQPALTNPDK